MAGVIDGLVAWDGPKSWLADRGCRAVPLNVDGSCFIPCPGTAQPTPPRELVPGFIQLTKPLSDQAAAASSYGPVLYIHLEFHAGTGTHEALGWLDGEIAFGPSFTATPTEASAHYVAATRRDMAINAGLRWLGVVASKDLDEFATVGLTRHRWNEEWIDAATDDP